MIETTNHQLAELLYRLSSALLLPVVALLIGLLVAMLVTLGGLLREWRERGRVRQGLREAARLMAEPSATPADVWQALTRISVGLPLRLTARWRHVPDSDIALRALVAELESDIAGRLARLGFVTRVGPMLGLLGTLIPFGPALSGLSDGNLQQLSANLITAFATTVAGLLCGCLAYGAAVVRRCWYTRDFDQIELIVNGIVARTSDEATEAASVGLGD